MPDVIQGEAGRDAKKPVHWRRRLGRWYAGIIAAVLLGLAALWWLSVGHVASVRGAYALWSVAYHGLPDRYRVRMTNFSFSSCRGVFVAQSYWGMNPNRHVRSSDFDRFKKSLPSRFSFHPNSVSLDQSIGPLQTLRWQWRVTVHSLKPDSPTNWMLFLEIPYWLLMLPFAALLLWWLWCPPGRILPLLTVRRLIFAVALAAAALACFARLWHVTEKSRAEDAIVSLGGTKENLAPSGYVVYLGHGLQTESDLARFRTAVATLPGLRKFYFTNSRVLTDDGLRYLEDFTELRKLDLTGTRVTQAGVESLQRALPDTEILSDFPIAGVEPAPAGENR